MTDFNQSVLDDIKASVEQYIKLHKKLPTCIAVSQYQFDEVRKARQSGVKITIMFKSKEVSPCVVEAYQGPKFDKRYRMGDNKTASGQPYGEY